MFWEAMEFPDVMEEKSGCSFRCDRCVRQNEVYSFGDSIHDYHDGVMSRGLREFDHKIDTECHDLAKQLSYYLYFFSFSFSFLLSWTYYTEGSAGKCHVTSVT